MAASLSPKSKDRPPLNFAAAKKKSGDGQLEHLASVPRIVRRADQFEDSAQCRPLPAPQTNLDALPQGQAPSRRDLIPQFGDDRGSGLVARIQSETDLMLAHLGKPFGSSMIDFQLSLAISSSPARQ